MEVTNINKLIRDPKNYTLKQLKGQNWFVISLPVVFRDGKYAIYYSKGAYRGQFVLMKNIDDGWKDVCYSVVWQEQLGVKSTMKIISNGALNDRDRCRLSIT